MLQAVDLRGHDAQRLLAALGLALGRAEIGAEIEQVVLDARQHGVGFGIVLPAQRCAADGAARQADHRVGLVDGAVGLDPRIVLGHALAAAERGLAAVAAARVDTG